ncbi:MAG TPA: HAMP domain-containing sensor histidine kinase [Polyangiaceae bacterium]|nr:HAMP domain-containing sensor histidine kinase [Polyangiaceae bacterium]
MSPPPPPPPARPSPRPRQEWPLASYLLLGVLAGATYVGFDLVSEARLSAGTLTGPLASAHDAIDHLIPVLAGGLIGLSIHQRRLRARLSAAEEAAERADALRARLLKVERDQAVWVLAAAVLHELNNPLHALGLILDEYQACADDSAQRAELVERAHAQVRRALAHLETLRSMQGSGEPEVQPIALDRVLASLAADVSALGETAVLVRVECTTQVMVSADPSYLRAILENLLDNSLHSLRAAQGGVVTMTLGTEAGRAVVHVVDDGPALDPNVRTTLFDPLRTTKSHGLGLGLPIARALARAMHGELSLGPAAEKSFRLELPLSGSS